MTVITKEIDWINPIEVISKFTNEQYFICLYSASNYYYSGKYSYIALYPNKIIYPEEINDNHFSSANSLLDKYFGFYSYEINNNEESYSFIKHPKSIFIQFNLIVIFNHENNSIEVNYREEKFFNLFSQASNTETNNKNEIEYFSSNMTDEEYLKKVEEIKDFIKEGELYQVNLTRKYFGEFKQTNEFEIFKSLMQNNPSPYSAFCKFDDLYIISSSPELFMRLDENNNLEARPIKGTARRNINPDLDKIVKNDLLNSEKNRSENLMIVDLLRNDLNKSCNTGSVQVSELIKLDSYKNLHHLSSHIKGLKRNDITNSEVILNAFPPGSMTGAPKIAVIKAIKDLEKISRGIYSGILGWFTPNKGFEFSIIIRTIIIKDNKFEFQAGGGIVYDSIPEDELKEIKVKIETIFKTLNIFSE